MEGKKLDSGKRRWSLVPWSPMGLVVDVLEFGARKYAVNNWQKVPDAKQRYVDAAARHIIARLTGELLDTESGLPHLAHAACCCLFAIWFDEEQATDRDAPMMDVLASVVEEIRAAQAKHGENAASHPNVPVSGRIGTVIGHQLPTEKDARNFCEALAKEGDVDLLAILAEEVCEVESASRKNNVEEQRKELLQVAGVAVGGVLAIDARGAREAEQDEHNALALSDHYQREATIASVRLQRVRELLETNGCNCKCDHRFDEHEPECERCLACRVSETVGGQTR